MKKFVFLFIILLSASLSRAQSGGIDQSFWGYTYDISFPIGSTADYIDDVSWRGFTVEGRKFIQSNLSVGGSFSWHVFNGIFSDPVEFSIELEDLPVSGAVSGEQFRYINSFPLLVNAHYYYGHPSYEQVSIFGGLGVGTYVIKRRTEIGIIAVDDTNWHFAVAPELGVTLGMKSTFKFLASAKYSYAFKAGDSDHSYSYLTVRAGFVSLF